MPTLEEIEVLKRIAIMREAISTIQQVSSQQGLMKIAFSFRLQVGKQRRRRSGKNMATHATFGPGRGRVMCFGIIMRISSDSPIKNTASGPPILIYGSGYQSVPSLTRRNEVPYTVKPYRASFAAQPKSCSACFVPVMKKIQNNRNFTLSPEKGLILDQLQKQVGKFSLVTFVVW